MTAAARAQPLLEYAPAVLPRDDVVSGMLPVTTYQRERFIDAVDLTVCGQPKPHLVVFAHDQFFVESPQLLDQLSGNHHAGQSNDGRPNQQVFQYPSGRDRPATGAGRGSRIAGSIHHSKPRVAPFARRMATQRRDLDLEFPRQPEIVGVQKGDQFALRFAQRGIAYYRGSSGVRQPDHFDARWTLEAFQVSPGVGARAVIRDDEFPVLEGLGE